MPGTGRTTPPRPVDVTAVLPRLAPLARTATRLHPRPGSPSPHHSSVGGPPLWPAGEPWPYCAGPHVPDGNPATSPQDVRLGRRIRAAAESRPPGHPRFTPEETAVLRRISAGHPWPDGPVAMLPVAQLYARDVPSLRPPGRADLLQVLWCPFDHPPEPKPRTALFRRSAAAVTDVLTTPPEPAVVQSGGYVPRPCLLDPEQVTEYPDLMELDGDSRALLGKWSTWQAAGAAPDAYYEPAPQEFYRNELSVAPGWKAGGWTRWGLTDPVPRVCPACGTGMAPLLTVASAEWDDSTRSWSPYEELTPTPPSTARPQAATPAMVQLAGGYDLQLYTCPAAPDHPHVDLIQ
ncbi:hypothetical protein [Streptomyces mobaraensis]|uniref:DUF1963 domain-containing protein n=1 Tax=Streptomyces mobaraensis TaxID=35621 RepID=A0A5N5VYH1_STRMB|nr:hypothetical protein [Streptomyces mobaraensis]KAB7833820.1 hypothetical protein FRZ00_32350 [Streptomyces mobaraensis]